LILGSVHYAIYQEPSVERLLPVRVTGLKSFSSLPSLRKSYGGKGADPKDLWVQDSKLVRGKALIEEKGTPILAEMTRGKGKVFYLALDVGRPPVARWEGLPLLFRDLLQSSPEVKPLIQTTWDESVLSQLILHPAFFTTHVPVRSLFLGMLLYLCGLGLWVWLWQQRRLPPGILLPAFGGFLVLSALGGYLHFHQGLGAPAGVLVSATVMEPLSDGYVETQSNVALFSTQGRDYSLRVESGWSDFEPVPRSGVSQDAALVLQDEGRSTRLSFPLREWDYRLFTVRSTRHFPLSVDVQSQDKGLLLRVANLTSKDLTECWVLFGGQRLFLGDIPRGSSQVRAMPLAVAGRGEREGHSPWRELREINFGDRARDLLVKHSFFPQDQDKGIWGRGSVLLFGWVRDAPRRIWVDDERILNHDYTLFRTVIPVEADEESGL